MKTSFDFLCIDERDSPNLKELTGLTKNEIKRITNRRYFGLCGVNIPGSELPELNQQGRRIQQKCFHNEIIKPFHYVEILNNKDNFAFLGADPSRRNSIIDLLNNFVTETKFKVFASFIDKQQLALKHGIFKNQRLSEVNKIRPNICKPTTPSKINLYEIALKYLIADYYKYLSSRKKRGIIISEARGEAEDQHLLNAFYSYQKSGAGSLSGKEIRQYIIDLMIIRKSQNHMGIQLADLITYPLYDYKIPDHNIRSDHFIKAESFENKIQSIRVFP